MILVEKFSVSCKAYSILAALASPVRMLSSTGQSLSLGDEQGDHAIFHNSGTYLHPSMRFETK